MFSCSGKSVQATKADERRRHRQTTRTETQPHLPWFPLPVDRVEVKKLIAAQHVDGPVGQLAPMLDIVGHGTLQSFVDPGHDLVSKHVLDLHAARMDHTKCNEKNRTKKLVRQREQRQWPGRWWWHCCAATVQWFDAGLRCTCSRKRRPRQPTRVEGYGGHHWRQIFFLFLVRLWPAQRSTTQTKAHHRPHIRPQSCNCARAWRKRLRKPGLPIG